MILQGETEKKSHIYYEFDRTQDQIGAGGMGIVFRGKMVDENTGAFREVAIKEIQPEGDSATCQTILDRAKREASIQIRNDDLVEMLGFVETSEKKLGFEKKRFYVVSEFLDGVTLDKVLEGKYEDYSGREIHVARDLADRYNKDREETAAMIIKHVISAIVALHDKGYLHRDIDPSNIMITSDGRFKLIDFGIAKKVDSLSTEDGMRSEEGAFVGKVEYAAPELISGSVSQQNFTTDIYAIGVLFYKLLTGRLPFEGNRFEIVKGQMNKKPNLGIIQSKKYRSVVGKAMEKQQQNRFATASSMRAALDGPDPAPAWMKYLIAASGILAISLMVMVLTKGKERVETVTKEDGTVLENHWKGDRLIRVDTVYKPTPPIPVEEKVDYEKILSLPIGDIWEMLFSEENRYNSAALFAASLYYRENPYYQKPYASKATDFWKQYIAPSSSNYLTTSDRNITTKRLEYIMACMAFEHLEDVKWSDEGLEKRISAAINDMVNDPNYVGKFKLPQSSY